MKLSCLLFCSLANSAVQVVESPYTQRLQKLKLEWLKNKHPIDPSVRNLRFTCYRTPGNELYIGVQQLIVIHAPLKSVVRVFEDSNSEIFDGEVRSHVLTPGSNPYVLYTEHSIPFFFVPNEKTKMLYQATYSYPERVLYSYQLVEGNYLNYNDGLLLFNAGPITAGSETTYLTEIDFWDANWGIAKALGETKIWSDSLRSMAQANLAIRLKAEHPKWSNQRILNESLDESEALDFSDCIENRSAWSPN